MLPFLWLATAEPAMAKDGQFGAIECLPESLIHPIVLVGLLGASLFAADAGWKWRWIRTDESSKQIKALEAENEKMKTSDGDEGAVTISNPLLFKENEEKIAELKKK